MGIAIPDDWQEGDGYNVALFCFPKSRQWRAIITGIIESLSWGWTWDRKTGTIRDAQAIGRDIFGSLLMPDLNDFTRMADALEAIQANMPTKVNLSELAGAMAEDDADKWEQWINILTGIGEITGLPIDINLDLFPDQLLQLVVSSYFNRQWSNRLSAISGALTGSTLTAGGPDAITAVQSIMNSIPGGSIADMLLGELDENWSVLLESLITLVTGNYMTNRTAEVRDQIGELNTLLQSAMIDTNGEDDLPYLANIQPHDTTALEGILTAGLLDTDGNPILNELDQLGFLSAIPALVQSLKICCTNIGNKSKLLGDGDLTVAGCNAEKCNAAAVIVGHGLYGLSLVLDTTTETYNNTSGLISGAIAWYAAKIEAAAKFLLGENTLEKVIALSGEIMEQLVGQFTDWVEDDTMSDAISAWQTAMPEMVCAICNADTVTAARSALEYIIADFELPAGQIATLLDYASGLNVAAAFGGTSWDDSIGGSYLVANAGYGEWYTGNCGECITADCVNANNRPLAAGWVLGSPSLYVNDTWVSGDTTAVWDYVIWHVAFSSLPQPIPVVTINSISTPSVNISAELCDGTEIDSHEVLASALPQTFYNVVRFDLTRQSGQFTVNITFG